ncbi:putative MscS family protein YkuT [compost metagenome]
MFAALMNPKLAQFLDRAWEATSDWVLTNGVPLVLTLAFTLIALKLSGFMIDRIGKAILSGIQPGTNPRMVQRSTTLTHILHSTIRTLIAFAGLMMALSEVGINITPILASAGIAGLAVGFGAQSLVKDVITGFFILLEDQYGVGDLVDIDTKIGIVEKMNLRITQLRSLDGSLITVPNGAVSLVSNMSKEWARALVEVNVPMETDIDRALALMLEEGVKLREERPHLLIEAPEAPGVVNFAEYAVTLRVMVKTAPLEQWAVGREWRRRIKAAFDREGIEIAVPHRVYRVHNEAEAKALKAHLGS